MTYGTRAHRLRETMLDLIPPRQAAAAAIRPATPLISMNVFDKKVAVVTGAGRGLGKAVALELAKEGYALALCALHREGLDEVALEVTKEGGLAMVEPLDVGQREQVVAFFKDIDRVYGRVDVLVNNAGYVHRPQLITDTLEGEMGRCFRTNVMGPFFFMREAIDRMRSQESRGAIVNVASKAGRYAVPGMAAYNASKAALVSLTQTTAKELRETKIRCLSVSPGGMNTEMRAKVYGAEDAAKQQSPEFVADVIADIVTDRNKIFKIGLALLPVPSGADVFVWRNEVRVFSMEEMK